MAVVRLGVVDVLVDNIAIEVDAGEEALVAGVREEPGVGEDASGGLRIAADWAGGHGYVTAELNLLMQETLCAFVCHCNEDEVGSLATDLEAKAGTGELDEGRSAPAMAGAAGDDALAVFAADDECSFLEAWNNGYAGSMRGYAIGKAVVGGVHEFMKNLMGCIDAGIEFGFVSRVGVGADEGGKHYERQQLFH